MKELTTVALMLTLGVADIHAQQRPLTGSFSGTAAPSTIVLQQGTVGTSEYQFDGNGALAARGATLGERPVFPGV